MDRTKVSLGLVLSQEAILLRLACDPATGFEINAFRQGVSVRVYHA